MNRFLIFTFLFPPLVLLIYVSDLMVREGLPGFGFLAWLMMVAYVLAVVPAWLTAAVDWLLSGKSLYLRLVVVMAVAALLAELVARYMGQPSFDLAVAIAGAIPAAVCSWLSNIRFRA